VLPVLFRRPLDRHQTAFALGEALAHLHYLERRGALDRVYGADGVDRFLRANAERKDKGGGDRKALPAAVPHPSADAGPSLSPRGERG
jgi:hypothetical protein